VYEVEAQYILSYYPDVLRTGIPHSSGASAFLMEDLPDGRVVEMLDTCPLNDAGEPIVNLSPEKCW